MSENVTVRLAIDSTAARTHAERMASAIRSIAIAQESLRQGLRQAAQSLSDHLHVLRAWDNGATPVDRVYARRYLRAVARSRRNQPPAKRHDCPRCRGHGFAGVWEGEPVGDCPRCDGWGGLERRGASLSRKRRPHGRPR